MEDLLIILSDNILLIAGLGFAGALLVLKMLAAKTANKIDDGLIVQIEANKITLIARIAKYLKARINKK